jgi:hypothetical protein
MSRFDDFRSAVALGAVHLFFADSGARAAGLSRHSTSACATTSYAPDT